MLMSISTCIVITQMLVLSKGAPKLGHILYDPLSGSSYTNEKYYPNNQRVQEYYLNPPIIKSDANIEEENTKALKLGEISGKTSSESSYTNGKYYPYIRRVKNYYPNPPIIKRRDANLNDENTKASKLGESFGDPSSESSSTDNKYNLNNRRVKEYYPNPLIIKRRDTNVKDENTEAPCGDRYEYDEMKCTIINNRILCGYNKNNGKVKNSAEVVNMGNGCRMRNNRIECGYLEGPFDGSVRPGSRQKLTLIKPTRTLSREKKNQKLRASLREPKTKHTSQTSITINTITADNKIKLTFSTATIDVSKQSNCPHTPAFDNKTAENVTNEGVTKNEINPNVTPKMVNNNIKLNLRTLIVLMASTTPKSMTNTTAITSTSSVKTVARVADSTVVQNKTTSNEESTRNSILVEMTTITPNSTKINVTEDKTNDDPPPLCIDREDRIICYDTAKFILFKKPTKT